MSILSLGERQNLYHQLHLLQANYKHAEQAHDLMIMERLSGSISYVQKQLGIEPAEAEPAWLTKARSLHFLPSDHTQARFQERVQLAQRLAESEAALQQAIQNPLNESGARYMNRVKALQAQLQEFVENPWRDVHSTPGRNY